jgi:hypothetical protein
MVKLPAVLRKVLRRYELNVTAGFSDGGLDPFGVEWKKEAWHDPTKIQYGVA